MIDQARDDLAPERVETERLLREAARSEQAAVRLRGEAEAERAEAARSQQAARHAEAQRVAAEAARRPSPRSGSAPGPRPRASSPTTAQSSRRCARSCAPPGARSAGGRRRRAEARTAEAERDRRLGAADEHARTAARAIDEALDAPIRQTRALAAGDRCAPARSDCAA